MVNYANLNPLTGHSSLFVYLTERGRNLINLVNYFKRCSSKIGKEHGIERLWQRRYYDHIVRREESLRGISEYIYDNAKRKGLVENSEDYLYSEIKYELLNI